MNRKDLVVICITFFAESAFLLFFGSVRTGGGGVVNIGCGRFLFGCGFGAWWAVTLKPWLGRLNVF